jgi:hypothetical protein
MAELRTHVVNVDDRSVVVVPQQMVVSHTDLTEVTRMVLEISVFVVLSTSCSSKVVPVPPSPPKSSQFSGSE